VSLPKKDVKVYLDPDVHAAFNAISDLERMTMQDLAEKVIRKFVQRRVHEANVLAEKLKSSGINRIRRGSAGIDRDATD